MLFAHLCLRFTEWSCLSTPRRWDSAQVNIDSGNNSCGHWYLYLILWSKNTHRAFMLQLSESVYSAKYI